MLPASLLPSLLALLLCSPASSLSFSLSNTVASSMLLQRDTPTTSLWGFADAGLTVTALLSSSQQAFNGTAGSDGIWRVALPALPATAEPFNITFSAAGAPDISISDVVVGDLVLCSGQVS